MGAPSAPATTPVETPVRAPTQVPDDMPGPEKFYNPERLCPDQKRDGGWRTRPS